MLRGLPRPACSEKEGMAVNSKGWYPLSLRVCCGLHALSEAVAAQSLSDGHA